MRCSSKYQQSTQIVSRPRVTPPNQISSDGALPSVHPIRVATRWTVSGDLHNSQVAQMDIGNRSIGQGLVHVAVNQQVFISCYHPKSAKAILSSWNDRLIPLIDDSCFAVHSLATTGGCRIF